MDDKQKKKINDAIPIFMDICEDNLIECVNCPLYKHICNGLGGLERQPYLWQMPD